VRLDSDEHQLRAGRVLRTHWETVEHPARASGRHVSRSVWRTSRNVHVAQTTAQARREVLEGSLGRDFRDYCLPLLGLVRQFGPLKVDSDLPDEQATLDHLLDQI
jgi:hypothetical protein